MRTSSTRILTTHAGSLPRSPALIELNARREQGTASEEDLAALLRSAQRELLLVKVKADVDSRGQVLDAVQLFRAKVVDVAPDAITIQAVGNADKLADLLRVLEPFGIRELVQSGMVAIGRGSRSISERTLRPVTIPAPPAAIGG